MDWSGGIVHVQVCERNVKPRLRKRARSRAVQPRDRIAAGGMHGAREDHHLREAHLKHLPRGQAGLDPEGRGVRDHHYLEHPPSALELKKILREAGLKPHEAVRSKELKELAGERKFSDDGLIAFMAKHPEVIQRPLVVKGSKAVLARPVERLSDLGV